MTEWPTGLVNFLMTDIEGSTRLWEKHPAEMEAALARHDSILRHEIKIHDGVVFSLGGDSFSAAFHLPDTAADTAVAIQRALAAESWPGDFDIRVRIGVHTGLPEKRGDDYFGTVVNRAARLMSAGHGGQVLVSTVTHELLPGRACRDLGLHRLKDLSAPERIWQLVIDELDNEHPALMTLDRLTNNLPVRVSSFVGRDDELALLKASSVDHRVVTLCGTGGVGKTSLSLQVAAQIANRYDDGVWFVELAPVSGEGVVPFQFLDTLGLTTESGRTPLDAVIAALGENNVLLVLDNCEHVRAETATVTEAIITRCPEVTIIASSREPLGVTGEVVHNIGPLSTSGADSPALRLLSQRVAEANPGLELTDERRQTLIRICDRLDGLPLAIELAAARARSMTPEDLADRLSEQFRVLKGRSSGSSGGDERQATLHNTIQWSYELLSPQERLLFERLAVFNGDFTTAAAEAVCSDDQLDDMDVFDHIDHLVDQSMVVADLHASHAQYSMLQSIREFALEQLGDATSGWRRRHAEYYAEWIRDLVGRLRTNEEEAAIAELDSGWDNVRAAVAFAGEINDADLLRRLVGHLGFETLFRGRAEVNDWVAAALKALGNGPVASAPELWAVEACCASLAGHNERVAEVGATFAAAAAAAPDSVTSHDVIVVGFVLHLAGESELPLELYDLGESLARQRQDRAALVWAASFRSLLFAYTDRGDEARGEAQRARELLDETAAVTARVGVELVDSLRAEDSPAVIVERMGRAIEDASRVRCELIKNVCQMVAATARAQLGELGQARAEAIETLTLQSLNKNFAVLAQQLRRAAVMLMRSDDFDSAAVILAYLDHQRAPEPNPGTARELDDLIPVMRDTLGEPALVAADDRAVQMGQEAVTDLAVDALRAAGQE